MDQLLDLLFKFLIVTGIFATVALDSFFIWTALFIPIVKLRQHNQEKEKLKNEAYKIEIKKAESVILTDEKKAQYDQVVLATDKEKKQYDKWKKQNESVAAKFEAWLKIEDSKQTKNKTKKQTDA